MLKASQVFYKKKKQNKENNTRNLKRIYVSINDLVCVCYFVHCPKRNPNKEISFMQER